MMKLPILILRSLVVVAIASEAHASLMGPSIESPGQDQAEAMIYEGSCKAASDHNVEFSYICPQGTSVGRRAIGTFEGTGATCILKADETGKRYMVVAILGGPLHRKTNVPKVHVLGWNANIKIEFSPEGAICSPTEERAR